MTRSSADVSRRRGLSRCRPPSAAASPPAPAGKPTPAAVREWVRAHEADILREFASCSRSRTWPRTALRRNAEHIAAMLGRRGLTTRLLDGEGGPPAVYGERLVPGAGARWSSTPTTTASPSTAAEWATPPWTPTLRDGPLESGGRDDPPRRPGRAHATRSGGSTPAPPATTRRRSSPCSPPSTRSRPPASAPSVNLKLFLEGEEEAGSPHLRRRAREEQGAAEGRRLAPLRRAGAPDPPAAGLLRRARGHRRRDHALRPRRARSTAGTTATGPRTRRWRWPTSWPACATPTAASGSPASTTTCGR